MLTNFVDGITQHNDNVIRNIESQGLHIQHESTYSYTVGMTLTGLPEFIAYRKQGENTQEIGDAFKGLYNSLLENESAPRPTPLLQCSKFDDTDKRKHFFAARMFYGNWDFETILVEFKK